MNKLSIVLAVVLIGIVALGTIPPMLSTASSNQLEFKQYNWLSKVDKRLLDPSIYTSENHLPYISGKAASTIEDFKSSMSKQLLNPTEGKARALILYKGGIKTLEFIKKNALVYNGFTDKNGGILSAWVTMSQVKKLASNPGVISVSLQNNIKIGTPRAPDSPASIPVAIKSSAEASSGSYNLEMAPEITGATYAWSHGYNGTGVKVGVVDTGVDFGESDLGLQAIARDDNGLPLLFDADEMGLALTVNPTNVTGNTITVLPFANGKYGDYVLYYDAGDGGLWLTNSSIVFVYNMNTGNYTYEAMPVVYRNFTLPPGVNTTTPVNFGLISENIYVGNLFVWLLAPAITVDYNGDGTYDAVYIDLSSIYYMLLDSLHNLGVISEQPNESLLDYSFSDEPAISYGHEIAARDFTGDGVNDLSFGALAGAFNDANGIFGVNATLGWYNDYERNGWIIPGFDYKHGQWFDLVFDFYGHGTECAHVIASRGKVARPTSGPFGSTTKVNYVGIAPGAKLGAAPALWIGNVLTAELWLSGWDLVSPTNFTWVYTGAHKVDVISNSWGMSYLLLNGFASDADVMSLFEDFITLTTGTVIVHAAGNGGPGFGSMTIPGAATNVITVGASTLFHYRPIYNYLPGGYYQVVSWSDRGPTQYGYPKPDVVNIGSFEYSVARVIDGLGDGTMNLDLFGGTSEATPMTAGAVAIIIQALRDNGLWNFTSPAEQSSFIKALLKSTATDLGYDPFTQGSGHVNIKSAIQYIEEGKGILAYSSDSTRNMAMLLETTMSTLIGWSPSGVGKLLSGSYDTALYFGVMIPGSTKTMSLNLVKSNATSKVSVKAVHIKQKLALSLWRLVDTGLSTLYVPGKGFVPFGKPYAWISGKDLYLNLTAIPPGSRLLLAINPTIAKFLKADLAEIKISYPYNVMDPYGRQGNYTPMVYMGAEMSYWIDFTGDHKVETNETGRIQYDIREGNTYQIQIGDLQKAYKLTEDNMLSFLQNYFGINVNPANTTMAPIIDFRIFSNNYYGTNTTPTKVTGTMELYDRYDWNWISVPSTIGGSEINVTASIPANANPGVYEGYLEITSDSGTTLVPITISVPAVIDSAVTQSFISPQASSEFYNNNEYTNALDQSWRPEVGDWRTFPVLVNNTDNKIGALEVSVTWSNPETSFDVGIIGPGFNDLAAWFYGGTPAWVDGSVLALKDSIGLINGLPYAYFDWPTTTRASVVAYVPSGLFSNYDGYLLYWVIVHQVFSATGTDRPVVTVKGYKQYTNNFISLANGSKASVTTYFESTGLGAVFVPNNSVTIIPLGSTTGYLNVTPVLTKQLTHVSSIKTAIEASPDAHGVFLVMIPVVGANPGIIWGNEKQGQSYVFLYEPSVMYITLIVNVS
ncbi:MAG: S8 family serine peptidase [Desulfurococcales archaeon]|nr:S8 family serine peptidase [Desulfurococcales archaeon]